MEKDETFCRRSINYPAQRSDSERGQKTDKFLASLDPRVKSEKNKPETNDERETNNFLLFMIPNANADSNSNSNSKFPFQTTSDSHKTLSYHFFPSLVPILSPRRALIHILLGFPFIFQDVQEIKDKPSLGNEFRIPPTHFVHFFRSRSRLQNNGNLFHYFPSSPSMGNSSFPSTGTRTATQNNSDEVEQGKETQ
jgi:hypothetical protein